MEDRQKHFERTDVVWRPAVQVREGDVIYGPSWGVSKTSRVLRIDPSPHDFMVRIITENTLEMSGERASDLWESSAVAWVKKD